MTTTDREKIAALKTGAQIMNAIAHPEIAAVLAEVCNDLTKAQVPEITYRTPEGAICALKALIADCAERSEFGLDFVDKVEDIVESVDEDDIWDENGDDLKHPEPDGSPNNDAQPVAMYGPEGKPFGDIDPDEEQATADHMVHFKSPAEYLASEDADSELVSNPPEEEVDLDAPIDHNALGPAQPPLNNDDTETRF